MDRSGKAVAHKIQAGQQLPTNAVLRAMGGQLLREFLYILSLT